MSKSKKRPTSLESLRRKQKAEAEKLEKIAALIVRAEARERLAEAAEKLSVEQLRKLMTQCDEWLRQQTTRAMKASALSTDNS